ncbi:MAG TPA: mechanosensitive ion channel family protein [Dehalococcoidia bacterium]|nr:mechanosensitive ion channel family protein [Dehalococcoidia bacterium]
MERLTLTAISFDADRALEDVLTHGGRILLIAVIALIAVTVISRLIGPLVRVAVREQMAGQPPVEVQKRIDTLTHVTYRTTVVVVFLIAFLMALPELGLNVGPLIAGVGIFGLAVGFGAQSLVKDVITGMFILLENQYSRGDVVTIAGATGLVEDINLRRTVLRDLDGVVHFIPHGEIKTASNQTKGFSRVNLIVSVPYNADIDKAFEVINKVGEEMVRDPAWGPRIRQAPRALRIDRLADATVEIRVLGETEPMEQWPVKGELRRRLRLAFDAAGIRPAGVRESGPQAPPPAPGAGQATS